MKIFRNLMLGLILVFTMSTVVLAEENNKNANSSEKTVLFDGADILDETEEELIYEKAAKISKKHDINIIIYTEEEWINNSRLTAEDVYLTYFERDTDGILYYVNMSTRDYYFLTSGDVRKSLSDNYGLVQVEDSVIESLSDGFYYTSFNKFLKIVDKFEKEAKFGLPYCFINPYRTFGDIFIRLIIAIVAAVIIAFIRTGGQKAKLKTVKPQSFAKNYMSQDGFKVTSQNDTFLFKNVTRTAIPKSSSSSGGSSGSRSGGGSSSFGGRGGKF